MPTTKPLPTRTTKTAATKKRAPQRERTPRKLDPTIEPLAYRKAQAAQALGISVSSLEKLIRRGEIEAFRLGGCVLIARDDLTGYIARLKAIA